MKPRILVLCTGNSARSQMAAAFLEGHAGDLYSVDSAGTEPAAAVHPLTVAVMAEAGVDISDRRPQAYRDFLGRVPVHTVIIVCGGADKSCPAVWPGAYERLYWPFDDPAAADGSDEERLAVFRRVRDQIEERIVAWTAERRGASG